MNAFHMTQNEKKTSFSQAIDLLRHLSLLKKGETSILHPETLDPESLSQIPPVTHVETFPTASCNTDLGDISLFFCSQPLLTSVAPGAVYPWRVSPSPSQKPHLPPGDAAPGISTHISCVKQEGNG